MTGLIPALKVVDGIPRASSLDIATHFEKRHVDVMRAINNSVAQVPEKFAQRNFAFSDYQDSTGRTLPKCDLTHDGFSFVVMGFTGKKAAQWKVAYIMAFRAMAEQLEQQREPVGNPDKLPDAPITPDDEESPELAPVSTSLSFRADFPADMGSDRKEAMQRMERIARDMHTSFSVVRNIVRIGCHPGGYSMNRSLSEREAYRILENFYVAADESLAAAYNALEAGYRFGRLYGRG